MAAWWSLEVSVRPANAGTVAPRRPGFPSRCALSALGALTACAVALPASAAELTFAEQRYDMGILPENDLAPWTKLGTAPVILLADQTLLLNDNTSDDRIAYETMLGIPQPEHRITLTARVRVISNLEGRAAVMEVARPHLQAVLRLYPEHVELVERTGTNEWRWMGTVDVDLSGFREIELTKASSVEDPAETISVAIDGAPVLRARPMALGDLDAGRLVIGSVALPALGASIWDWVDYRLTSVSKQVPVETVSFGAMKSRFATDPSGAR
jgi:hypothetical protein